MIQKLMGHPPNVKKSYMIKLNYSNANISATRVFTHCDCLNNDLMLDNWLKSALTYPANRDIHPVRHLFSQEENYNYFSQNGIFYLKQIKVLLIPCCSPPPPPSQILPQLQTSTTH